MPEILACKQGELAPGESKLLPVGKFGVGIFNVGGIHHAVLNYCPHNGAPVCLGKVTGTAVAEIDETEDRFRVKWTRDGEILECPWHAWRFEIESGQCLTTRRGRIKKLTLIERGDEIYLLTPDAEPTEGTSPATDGSNR